MTELARGSTWKSKEGKFDVFVVDPKVRLCIADENSFIEGIVYTHADDEAVPPVQYARPVSGFLHKFEFVTGRT